MDAVADLATDAVIALAPVLHELVVFLLFVCAFFSTRAAFTRHVYDGVPDPLSAYSPGLLSRRWLFENVVLLVLTLALSTVLVLRLAGFDVVGIAESLHLPFVFVALVFVGYVAAAVRASGDYTDGPTDLPRTQISALRRPRSVFFRLRLFERSIALRRWILAVAAMVALWQISYLVGHCIRAARSEACDSDSLWQRILVALIGHVQPGPQNEPRIPALVAMACLNAALIGLPLVLGGVAAFTVCACSAADSDGQTRGAAAEQWVWPVGQVGEAAWQTPPFRTSSRPADAERVLQQQVRAAAAASAGLITAVPRYYPDSAVALGRLAAEGYLGGEPASVSAAPKGLRIVILTLGTRGDVQPFIALGHALRDAGHCPVICASLDFQSLVEESGIEFASSGLTRLVQPDTWASSVRTVAEMIYKTGRDMVQFVEYEKMYDAYAAAAKDADVVVGSGMTLTMAFDISEAMGIPAWIAKLCPDSPSLSTVPPGFERSTIGWLNYVRSMWYWITVALAMRSIGVETRSNACRKRLFGMGPPVPLERVSDMTYTPQLLVFSSHLFPKPMDYPPWFFEVGFWQVQDAEAYHARADDGLRAFLAAQPQPASDDDAEEDGEGAQSWKAKVLQLLPSMPTAVVTFGSMALARDSLLADIVSVLLSAGFKVVVLTGWKEQHPRGVPTQAEDPRVYSTPEASHDWLFAFASLVVHHGGAGTTGRALASGVASLIIPVLRWADQPTWGALAEARGVGICMNQPSPTRADIADALVRLWGPTRIEPSEANNGFSSISRVRDRANVLGVVVRAEPSASTAVTLLESCLCNLVLCPADADAVHPFAPPAPLARLSKAQRMCLRHCVPCHRLRTALQQSPGQSHTAALKAVAWGKVAAQPLPAPDASTAYPETPSPEAAREEDSSGALGLRRRMLSPPARTDVDTPSPAAARVRGNPRTRASSPPPPVHADSGSDDDATTEDESPEGASGDESADAELMAASQAKRARGKAAIDRMAALLRR